MRDEAIALLRICGIASRVINQWRHKNITFTRQILWRRKLNCGGNGSLIRKFILGYRFNPTTFIVQIQLLEEQQEVILENVRKSVYMSGYGQTNDRMASNSVTYSFEEKPVHFVLERVSSEMT